MHSTHFTFPLEILQTVEINPCKHLFPTVLLVPVSLCARCSSKIYRHFSAVCPHRCFSRRCHKVMSRVILTSSKSSDGKKYPGEEHSHGNAVWPLWNASSAHSPIPWQRLWPAHGHSHQRHISSSVGDASNCIQ